MKSLKKAICMLLAFCVILSTMGAIPMVAQAAKSDADLIMNLDLGAGSGTNTDYSAKDGYSDTYAKTFSWSNIAEVRTVDGKTALYNQNGYVYANVGNSNLYNNDSWRIEFMFKKGGSAQDDALLIGLGTANGSYNIDNWYTDDVLTLHQGGYISVCSTEINDASANEKLKINTDEVSYYSIIFSAQSEYLTLTKNGVIAFEMHLNENQINSFKHVGFISAGCHAGGVSRGWYTGTIDGYYYYIKAYNEPECPETVGKISVDPVIYTHGSKSATQNSSTGDYGYMMYGNQIADETVMGELKTEIKLPKGAVLNSVYCPDNDYVEFERSKGTYYLSGSFSSDDYQIRNNEEKYVRIRFKYTLNDKQYTEWHNFCVKTNPVPTHSMIYAQSYKPKNYVWEDNTEKSAVAFQVTALGSVGPASSGASFANWGATSSKTHNANSWNIYDPFNDELQCNTNDNGSVSPVLIEQNTNSVVDKTTGYAVAASNTDGEVNVGIYTDYAKYYVDKSADSILGAEHKAGESEYRIHLFLETLSQSYTSGQRVDVTEHNSFWLEDISESHFGEWAWSDKERSEIVTLRGSTDNGSTTCDYWYAAENQDGRKAKATIITKCSITVFDKTNARNAFNDTYSTKYNSSYYNLDSWKEYVNARLEVEGQLNNYELTEVNSTALNNLQNRFALLGSVADYSALIAAIRQAQEAVNKPDLYEDTTALASKLSQTKEAAFENSDISAAHLLDNQSIVDYHTIGLQYAYSETVEKKSNVEIEFSVFLDGNQVGSSSLSALYNQTKTLRASDIFPEAESYNVVKWTNGGTTVATSGYQFSFIPAQKCTINCWLISEPAQSESFCRVELYDISKRKNTEFFVQKSSTYAEIIAQAQGLTSSVLYYALSGWEINGATDYNLSDSIGDTELIKIYPIYTPTVDNYQVSISGGTISTGSAGYAFDAKAAVSFEGDGSFVCWAVKYDSETYRIASYDETFNFYVSGNMDFIAITEENFSSYASKLQKNSTSENGEETAPTLEELIAKKAIPSMRGPAEDESAIDFGGAYWDEENSKLIIVAQVAGGAKYASCGTIALYNGKTVVTPSVSQTAESNQFMISYKLGTSFKNRKIKIMAFAKENANNDELIYSPAEEITIPAEEPIAKIGNSITSQVKYDLEAGTYDVIKNNANVISNVTADFTLKDGRYLDVSWYENHTPKIKNITDGVGNGTQLTITSTSWGWPDVEQIFKVYDNKDYVLSILKIYNSDGSTIESNYCCPVYVKKATNFKDGKQPWSQFLHVPYDNDGWSIFKNYSLKKDGSDVSHEFTALYDADNLNGLIIGSVTHDDWKTGVFYGASSEGVNQIKAYGGAASVETAYRPGYNSDTSRGLAEHGYVKGSYVKSPTIFIGDYSDWRYGVHQYTSANTAIVPMRTAGDLGGVPFGWQSWGSIAGYLNYDNAMGNINAIKNNLQTYWETDENGNPDGTPIVMNLDSGAGGLKLPGGDGDDDPWNDNDNALRAFVAQCEANGQVPGIYHTPFTNWCSYEDLTTPGEEWWTHPDWVLKKDGEFVPKIGGVYPLDVTHPEVIQNIVNAINHYKELGFRYVKLDFLNHGFCEGDFYNPDITTGMQAYNYAMKAITDAAGDDLFINFSIAPLFPYQYANGRRMGCDTWYNSSDCEYILNQITYGFWEGDVYNYPDPDHTVIYSNRDNVSTENEAKMMVTANAIAGANMLLGDSFYNYNFYNNETGNLEYSYTKGNSAIERAKKFMTNRDIIALAKRGKTFEPVMDDNLVYHSKVFRMEDDNGDIYYAIFRFDGDSEWYYRLNLPSEYNYVGTELWSGNQLRDGDPIWLWVDVDVPNNDAVIYKFTRV